MEQFIGQDCPICSGKITKDDKVVVCPDCGAPYHRDCYKKQGCCIYEAQHSDRFNWHPKEAAKLPTSCKNCNTTNAPDKIFCENCGFPLNEKPPTEVTDKESFLSAASAIAMYEKINNIDKEAELDGVKIKDWYTYIGGSAPQYIMLFKRMDETGQKVSFCISAMLFAPFYFLFRRMWSLAILSGLLNFMLNSPSLLLVLSQNGYNLPFDTAWLTQAADISYIFVILLNGIWGIFAIYLYRVYSGKKLRRMKEKYTQQADYEAALANVAGPSKAIFIIFVIIFALTILSPYIFPNL